MTLAAGTLIGKYVVKRKLAEGGMAEIFLCKSVGPEGFEKEVVIKRIRPFLASDPKFVEMFIKEAQLASRLNHANIVQIFDFDKHEDTYYLAMEYVHGRSLSELRKKCKMLMQPVPATLVAHIGAEVARGLHAAHKLTHKGKPLGIVHRDVTPHNVLLSFDGAVKLTDFGIAKVDTTATAPGVLKGKFSYMSPEQARGEVVDARTDTFALGIVLWEMLTGGKLFEADNEIAVLRAVQYSQIPPPSRINPDVPENLSEKILKALQRDVDARYQSAQELERDLKQFVIEHAEHFDDTDVGGFLRKLFPEEATVVRGMSLSAPSISPDEKPEPEAAPREKTAVQTGSAPARPPSTTAETNLLPRTSPKTERMPSVKPRTGEVSVTHQRAAEPQPAPPSSSRATVHERSVSARRASPEPSAPAPDLGGRQTEQHSADEAPAPAPEPTQIVRNELPPEEAKAAGPNPVTGTPPRKPSSSRGLLLAGAVFLVGIGVAVAVGMNSARSAGAGGPGVNPLSAVAIDAGKGELALSIVPKPVEEHGQGASAAADAGRIAAANAGEDAGRSGIAGNVGAVASTVVDAGAAHAERDAADAGAKLALMAHDAGVELAVKAAAVKKKGTLRLGVAPWAKVVIDGVGRGEVASPKQFSLDVGEHRLRLEHPRGNREQKIVIQAGQTTTVTVNMLAPP